MLKIWIRQELDLCALIVSDCIFNEDGEILDDDIHPVEGFILPSFHNCRKDRKKELFSLSKNTYGLLLRHFDISDPPHCRSLP